MSGPHGLQFDELLRKLNLTENVYILVLQSSLQKPRAFLRSLQEICINAGMKHLLSAWQANHDIRFIFNVWSCIAYISDYMMKSQKGMNALLTHACEETKVGNMTLKQSVRHVDNTFLNSVENCAQECC